MLNKNMKMGILESRHGSDEIHPNCDQFDPSRYQFHHNLNEFDPSHDEFDHGCVHFQHGLDQSHHNCDDLGLY